MALPSPSKLPPAKKARPDDGAMSEDSLSEVEIIHSTPAPQGPVTLEAIGALMDQKLGKFQKSIDKLLSDFGAFKAQVRIEVESMGLKIVNIDESCKKNAAAIHDLQTAMTSMKLNPAGLPPPPAPPPLSSRDLNIVWGNVPGSTSFEIAREWIQQQLVSMNIHLPDANTFHKSTYTGVVFTKCDSVKMRNEIIAAVQKMPEADKKVDYSKRLFAAVDKPIDERSARSVLLSIKYMLSKWGINKSAIQVDEVAGTLSIQGKTILCVEVRDYILNVKWCDGEWEQWEQLQNDPELADITSKAQDKLGKAKAVSSSSKGKGKTNPSPG